MILHRLPTHEHGQLRLLQSMTKLVGTAAENSTQASTVVDDCSAPDSLRDHTVLLTVHSSLGWYVCVKCACVCVYDIRVASSQM